MLSPNYFLIDGSALIAQIKRARSCDKDLLNKKLNLTKFIEYFHNALNELHSGDYKRCTFYFASGDEKRVKEYIIPLEYKKPGSLRDIEEKYCGKKLKDSKNFESWLNAVPSRYKDLIKREKGVDVQICCDALQLAGTGRLDRLFLLTNDSDFIPLCRTIKALGANISLLALSEYTNINQELVKETDSYDVIDQINLNRIFE